MALPLQFDPASFDFAQDEAERVGHRPMPSMIFLVPSEVEGLTLVLQ